MDNYIVSARKYRPDSFDSVAGQDSITQTLKNAVANHQIGQAYLFTGPRGVGKTTCARIFAKTINCSNITPEGDPCNECNSCKAFNEQRSMNIFELDAASKNSVENIKEIINQVRIPPQIGKYSVYIIDEVHMLSSAAFNAFLKTLEEPPSYAVFILATTEKYKIIPTILSRCQTYDFNRISISDIIKRLEFVANRENIQTEHDALHVIAQKADGGMRDALSIFDLIASFSNRNVTYADAITNLNIIDYDKYFEITDKILAGNHSESFMILDDILRNGFEGIYFINGLASHFRDLLVCKAPNTLELLEVGEKTKEKYLEHAKKCSEFFLFRAISILNNCEINYRQSQNKRLLIELSLLSLCNLATPISENNLTPDQNKEIETKSNSQQIQNPTLQQPTPQKQEIKTETTPPLPISNPTIPKGNIDNEVSITKLQTEILSANSIKNTPIDFEKLRKHEWGKFLETANLNNPKLNNYLKTHIPEKITEVKAYIKVENEPVKINLDNYLPIINKHFKNILENDLFEIFGGIEEVSVILEKNRETSKSTTEQKYNLPKNEQILNELIEKNPNVEKIYNEGNFSLE
ncbi:MAG: DNA polymerase III subunit gamma/tau [Bacteroidales bacterium]|jgi:DNA polymerase-3 subunit gamma/tau|nr:DNA polymerase III subunit gamma/tau [Bacteroidales bacterium]